MEKTEAMPAYVPGRLQVGTVLGDRYRLIAWLAEGGMGEVYRAEHVELGKVVAIKVMRPELSHDADFVSRFKREAIAASRIGHQNIVDISDFGSTEEGRFYIVMEFLDGRTLSTVMKQEGALAPARVIHLGLQVAHALAAAHRQGILHRDMKPDNVMLLQRPDQPDFVKVVDFGAAKVASGAGADGHTSIGRVVGTPSYMSPEQAGGLPVDVRADIYALGLILYELLVGKVTFSAQTASSIHSAHMAGELPALPDIPGLPDALAGLIARMVARRIHGRPASMDDVIAALERAAERPTAAMSGVVPVPAGQQGPIPQSDEVLKTVEQPIPDLLPRRPRKSLRAAARTELDHEVIAPPRRRWIAVLLVALVLGGAGAALAILRYY